MVVRKELPADGKPLKIKESVIEIFWALDGSKLVEVSAPFIPFYYFWLVSWDMLSDAAAPFRHEMTRMLASRTREVWST
eukprot:751759-Hanusia_phi.AAC.4